MIQVLTGNGRGKTSSAAGLAVRAAGHGKRVLFMQFLKDDSSGEIAVLRKIPGIEVVHAPVHYGFSYQMTEAQKKETKGFYDQMLSRAMESDAFLLVLDEITHALNASLADRRKVEKLLERDGEIVLTGDNAPAWLLEKADYVSEIKKIRHPFDQGVRAREGIEY